jgi:hypothetical protein
MQETFRSLVPFFEENFIFKNFNNKKVSLNNPLDHIISRGKKVTRFLAKKFLFLRFRAL